MPNVTKLESGGLVYNASQLLTTVLQRLSECLLFVEGLKLYKYYLIGSLKQWGPVHINILILQWEKADKLSNIHSL